MRLTWSGSLFVGITFITLGVLMIIIGPVAYSVINSAIDSTVRDNLIINGKEDDGFVGWQTNGQASDPPNLAAFYLFNVTNIEAVRLGETPILQEVGPYTYQQTSEKIDVEFNEDGTLVAYKWYDHYHFLPELSNGREEDLISTINAGYLGVLAQTGTENGLAVAVFAQYMTATIQSLTNSFLPQAILGSIPTTIATVRGSGPQAAGFDGVWASGANVSLPLGGGFTLDNWGPQWTTPNALSGQTDNLFNPTQSYSFLHPSQFGLWLVALQDQNAATLLQRRWSIDAQTQLECSLWLAKWQATSHRFLLTLSFGAPIEDLPYLQWGSLGLTTPASLYFLDSSVNFFVEFAGWSSFVNGDSPAQTFNVSLSKQLFEGNGVHSGFRNPQEVGQFLGLIAVQEFELIFARYGLTAGQAAAFAQFYQYVISQILVPALNAGGGMWTTHSARDFLFHYDDPLLALLTPTRSVVAVTRNYSSIEDVQANAKVEIRYTGEGDINMISWYKQWRGLTSVDYWAGEPEVFTGSGGTNFPPKMEKDVSWPVWSGTLERNIQLEYVDERDVLGLNTYSYTIPPSTFQSVAINPANARYYTYVDGLHNMTLAELVPGAPGVPLFLSKPHFLDVDPAQNEKIRILKDGVIQTGFTPDPAQHDSYINVEPISGSAIDYARRLQINVHLQPRFFDNFNAGRVPDMFLPVFYKEESSTLTEKQADALKDGLYGTQNLALGLLVGLLIGGVFLLVVGIVVIGFAYKQRQATSD